MKPRLYLRDGIWTCRSVKPLRLGFGYSPAEAYAEWRAEQ